jgi:hypothetical protein
VRCHAVRFYEQPAQLVMIRRVRVAADVPPAERARLEVLRSDSKSFALLLMARRRQPQLPSRLQPQ